MSLLVLAQRLGTPWPDHVFARNLSLLPAELHASVLRFRLPHDRQSRLAARLLLHIGLARLGCETSFASWRLSSEGKPFLADHPAYFSFSHAPGITVVAISLTGSVGVDAETPYALRHQDIRQVLGEEEYAHVQTAPNPVQEFARLWTVKEAVLKAQGRGLACDLHLLNALGKTIRVGEEEWYAEPLNLGGDWLCSLARQENNECAVLFEDNCDVPAGTAG